MTINEFKKIEKADGFDEAVAEFGSECDCITDYEILVDFMKHNIDEKNYFLARHILDVLDDNWSDDDCYWRYDYSMGTLETPTPIKSIDDIIDLLDDERGA